MLQIEIGVRQHLIEEQHRQDQGEGWGGSSESYRIQQSQERGLGWDGKVVEVGIGARRLVVIFCGG